MAEGMAKEREKAHSEKVQTARTLLGMGLSADQIAKATGLQPEEY